MCENSIFVKKIPGGGVASDLPPNDHWYDIILSCDVILKVTFRLHLATFL